MKKKSNDTIALIVTPLGEGGIGVVQVFGPEALEITGRLFRGKRQEDLTRAPSGSLFYGTLHDDKGLVDEVLVSVWRANGGSTMSASGGLVEINCHGGIMAVRKTLEALLKMGAREGSREELLDGAALHGDLGGLDLVQKEALFLLPRARTRLAVKVLLAQYESASGLSQEIKRLECEVKRLKKGLMECDTSGMIGAHRPPQADALLTSNLELLVNSSLFGLALTNPLSVTIAGAPNVGKSTLFNALLREDRAIVHHEPGTTRDYVSGYLSVEGVPLELIDTAGLREADGVEKIGVEWAEKLHQQADKVILVLDASRPITQEEEELISTLDARKVIPVLNKIDLCVGHPPEADNVPLQLFSIPPCQVSALEGRGLNDLKRVLIKDFLPEIEKGPHRPIVFTQRHKGLLEKALTIVRGLPENISDCFTASEVLEKLDDLERLFHTFLKT